MLPSATTSVVRTALLPQTQPCRRPLTDDADGPVEPPPSPARTITLSAALNSAVFPFAFDKFVALPLASSASINGLHVSSTDVKMNPARTGALLELGYPAALADPARPRLPIWVPLPSDAEGQVWANRIQSHANAVLAPVALAALASYGNPGPAPTSLVFTGATWAS
jgi:hypothetical protein